MAGHASEGCFVFIELLTFLFLLFNFPSKRPEKQHANVLRTMQIYSRMRINAKQIWFACSLNRMYARFPWKFFLESLCYVRLSVSKPKPERPLLKRRLQTILSKVSLWRIFLWLVSRKEMVSQEFFKKENQEIHSIKSAPLREAENLLSR